MITDAEFQDLMERIDEDLRKESVPIPARPLSATAEASKRLRMTIGGPNVLPAVPGRYDGLTTEAHIIAWYDRRYGDRLKMNCRLGSVVVMILGDPWRLLLPIVYGSVTITCDPDRKTHPSTKRWELPVCNVLERIEQFPPGQAAILTLEQRRALLNFFVFSMKTLQDLDGIADKSFIAEALADLESAVMHIMSHPAQYGLSRWASLQFMEKLLKSYLATKKATVPRNHQLQQLANSAQQLGLPALDPAAIAAIQCSAGVRYGEEQATLREAIMAHHASLRLAEIISEHIR